MAHPGIAWRALSWLTKANGPVGIALRELLRNIPWFIQFLRTGRPQAWGTAYTGLHDLNARCVWLYRDMLGDTQWHRLFRPTGALHVWRDPSPGTFDKLVEELRLAHGVAFDRLDAAELRNLEPGLSTQYQRGIFFPGSGSVTSPLELVRAIAERAVAKGAAIQTAQVKTVTTNIDGVTLQTTAGPHLCDVVVIAAGIASRDLGRSLGISISLASERGYHVTIPGVTGVIGRPVVDTASAFVATPLGEGLRIAGIAEFDAPDAPPNDRRSAQLLACAHEMLPDLRAMEVSNWMGVRPSTPDSLPIIGSHPDHENVLFATGHGHMGISGAPMTAALVCDLVARRAPQLSCAPYRLR